MPRRFLFVNFHPVDPHIVKFVAKDLIAKHNHIRFLYSEKEGIIEKIIRNEGFDLKRIGSIRTGIIGRIISSIIIEIRLIIEVLKFKPDIIFSPSSIYTGIASKFSKARLISWGDTETASLNLKLALPFIDALLLPDCFFLPVKNIAKEIRFAGYKELAYLHPDHFTPESRILKELNIKTGDKVVLMRFSALKAIHDIGLNSAGNDKAILLSWIQKIEKYARVFISMTEKDLGLDFQKYKLSIDPSEYIHLLAHCSLYIGEGTTSAAEAGVLGIPWIAIRPHPLGYLIDQEENYALGTRNEILTEAMETAYNWIRSDEILKTWGKKREKLLREKINVSKFLIWFLENYPNSHRIMKENPEYQNLFKS